MVHFAAARLRPPVIAAALVLASAAQADQPLLHELGAATSAAEVETTVKALVGFGTRHSLSDTASNKRGIGAARRWTQTKFEELSRACGGCLTIITPSQSFTGPRVPKATDIVDVVAIQKGTVDPNRVVVITGHIDSRVSDPLNASADAPGADDDASGVAVVLE